MTVKKMNLIDEFLDIIIRNSTMVKDSNCGMRTLSYTQAGALTVELADREIAMIDDMRTSLLRDFAKKIGFALIEDDRFDIGEYRNIMAVIRQTLETFLEEHKNK